MKRCLQSIYVHVCYCSFSSCVLLLRLRGRHLKASLVQLTVVCGLLVVFGAGSPLSSIKARLHPRCTAQARSSAAALRLVPYRAISIYFSPGAAASSNPAALG